MIPVNKPLFHGNELKYLRQCIETGWVSSEGAFVNDFEIALSNKVNRKYGIAVSNGSAALDVALAALNIGKGDEVIVPSHTIISCASAIVRSGAIPVLVDSDPITWNMDVNLIESLITSKTKAIMVVHLYGLPVDINKVVNIANKYKLKIIEDSAQMLGQDYYGKPCGSFGDISTFSFYPNKQITTGEGGMCVTNDEKLAQRCKSFRDLCFQPKKRFVHEELGWNYRLTNMQAALGLAQLENLDKNVARRRAIANKYKSLLVSSDKYKIAPAAMDYAQSIYWVFGIVLDDKYFTNATVVSDKLNSAGIMTRPFFYPIHLQPVFNKMDLFLDESYPISEYLGKFGFYVPCGLGIFDKEIEQVASALNKIFN